MSVNSSGCRLAVLLLASALFAGCSHALRITNTNEYFAPPNAAAIESLTLGVTSSHDTDPQNSRYVTAIVDALQRSGSFQRVVYPYDRATQQANVIIDINIVPHYTGRGSNFFVSFPGFLIWAPAIWGYGYNAEIETRLSIQQLPDGAVRQTAVTTHYKFRQAEIDRTWIEIGWLEVGIIPFIGGFAFTQYDPDVTEEFITKVTPYYGPYVARKLIESLPAAAKPVRRPEPAPQPAPSAAPAQPEPA